MIQVTIAFAAPEKQVEISLVVEENCSIALAITRSEIQKIFPEIHFANSRVGIFGRLATLDTLLQDGDRVEIYRPLVIDPKELRRKKAKN